MTLRQILPAFFIFLGGILPVNAQFFDDFSDGDFTQNPAWIGFSDSFTVSAGQLRTTVSNASNQVLYLSSATTQNFESWEFTFRMAFNPSSQNYMEFWLTTDNLNLDLAQNGYFVRLGGNIGDGIGLFKKVGGTITELIPQSGNTLLSGSTNNLGSIRVNRSSSGNWEIFEKITSTNFTAFGTASDNSLTSSIGLGVWIRSSKTNRSRHYFDDIKASLPTGPDLTPPNLVSANFVPPNLVDLQFSEAVDPAFSAQTNLYSLTPAQAVQSAQRLASNFSVVRLTLSSNLSPGNYSITANQSKDLPGNIQTTAQTVNFSIAVALAPRSIQINEIFSDPDPSVGLPSGEFVELYNPGNAARSLQNWTFEDATTTITLPNVTIPANGYLILCNRADTNAYKVFGKTVGVTLPSLNNTGDLLKLKDPDETEIDVVDYKLAWFQDAQKDDGGYSLEQINPSLKCSDASNWKASNALIGGTPGTANSIFQNIPDVAAPILDSVVVLNQAIIKLVFNEILNASPPVPSSFSIPGMVIENVLYQNPNSKSIILQLQNLITIGQDYVLTISNIKDCEGNQISAGLTRTFAYFPSQVLSPRQVVINEIYPDESPSNGLPEAEYLELMNAGSQKIQLKNMLLKIGSSQLFLPDFVLGPSQYVVICDEDKKSLFSGVSVLGVNLPLVNNESAEIQLLDFNNNLVDKVQYQISWFGSSTKSEGGYSLELINPSLPCSGKFNWRASEAPIGGTPGLQNSLFSNVPDQTAPVYLQYLLADTNQVVLQFSEPVGALSPQIADFQLQGGLSIVEVKNRFPADDNITLILNKTWTIGQSYALSFSGIKDCAGNAGSNVSFSFGKGKIPSRFQLLLSEIQADDTPENSLPQAEYVELFNASAEVLDLSGVQITDGNSTARLPALNLSPGEYLVLTGTSGPPKFASLPGIKVLGLTNFPTLNTEGDKLTLLGSNGSWIHQFHFQSNQYSPYSQWLDGWSLEMIDPQNPCDALGNWAISTSADGGTPGKQNSVKASRPDVNSPVLERAFVTAKDSILLEFDELVDSLSLDNASISVSDGYQVVSRKVSNLDFASIRIRVSPELRVDDAITITIGPIQDCAGNASSTQTAITARPGAADANTWVLNEILFDPKTGGTDYIELKNSSTGFRDLKNHILANDEEEKMITNSPLPVPPGGIVLLTTSTDLTMRDFPKGKKGNFFEMTLPSFNSDSGTVRLIGPNEEVWQKFFYSDKFHATILDETKGVSLERISGDLPVNEPNSWQSASADAGFGTPGYENSQSRNFNPGDGFSADPKTFSPNGDGNKDFTLFSYQTSKPGLIGNLRIYSSDGLLVKNLAESANMGAQGVWKWDGTDENGRKSRIGLYIAVLEVTELGSGSKQFKLPVAIAAER
jgi:hypothetical protein